MKCVDASVAVKWVLNEDWSDSARALYRDAFRVGEVLVAPSLLPFEVTNIVRRRMRVEDGPSLAQALELLATFLAFSVKLQDPPGLHHQALILADAHGLPAAYDAHYLGLAEHFDCEFWTDDQRLLRSVGRRLRYVRTLAEYEPAEN